MPTAAGMAIHRAHVPDKDATVVARLRQAGFPVPDGIVVPAAATDEEIARLPDHLQACPGIDSVKYTLRGLRQYRNCKWRGCRLYGGPFSGFR